MPIRPGKASILNPELEWIQAAHSDSMTYEQFRAQPVEYQEKMIAAYRVNQRLQAVIEFDNRPKKKK